MSERTKLLKKAVMTSVGATSNVDRIKNALQEAMQDLVKVGSELIDELEEKGKIKTETAQSFVKNFKEEASKRTGDVEHKISVKVQGSMKKAAKELGLATREEIEEILERLLTLEESVGGTTSEDEHDGGKKKRGRKAS